MEKSESLELKDIAMRILNICIPTYKPAQEEIKESAVIAASLVSMLESGNEQYRVNCLTLIKSLVKEGIVDVEVLLKVRRVESVRQGLLKRRPNL